MSDLSTIIKNFDDDELVEEPTSGELISKTPSKDELSVQMWGQFCFDLVLQHPNHASVCADYGIDEAQLLVLLENKAFVDRLKDAKMQVETLGPNAGFVLLARTQAEEHIVTLGKLARQEGVHPGIRVKAIENIVRYAHLDPQTQKLAKENERGASSPGVLVQFNIGGGLLGGGMKTIEVAASSVGDGE